MDLSELIRDFKESSNIIAALKFALKENRTDM